MVSGERVFISHASEDRPVAESVVGALEAAGMPCWIAPRDILGGLEWSEAIVNGMDRSRLVVVVLSAHSNESKYVRREVGIASSRDLPIIPFRVAAVRPTGSMEFFLASRHRLDAFTHPLDYHLRQLVATAASLLGRETKLPVTPEEPAKERFEEILPDKWSKKPGWARRLLGSLFEDR